MYQVNAGCLLGFKARSWEHIELKYVPIAAAQKANKKTSFKGIFYCFYGP